MTILLIVFLGTLYPIYYEVVYNEKFSVGPNYFSELITPAVFTLIILFTAEQFPKILSMDKLKLFIILVVATIAVLIMNSFSMGLFLSGIFLAILIFKAIFDFLSKKKSLKIHKVLGHLAVASLTFSVLLNHEFSKNIDFKIKPNDQVEFMGTNLIFKSADVIQSQNFNSVVANFEVEDKGKYFNIVAEKRRYKVGGVITSETGIAPYITKDYLVVLGDLKPDGSWVVRYSIKYGIMMIWVSSCLLLLSILYGTIRRHDY
jgi:Cytochrome c biogenesis factor